MILFQELMAVILGGALGSVLRFLLSRSVNEILPKNYPWGIWVVNLLGCLLIGVVAALFMHKFVTSVFSRTFVMVGVLGGFTTFSSFSLDTFSLFQEGEVAKALIYASSTVFISIIMTAAAFYVTRTAIS